MKATQTIAAVAVLVVLAALIMPYVEQTGFATIGCTGRPVLALSAERVQAGMPVVARVSGLNNCAGQAIEIRLDSCAGNLLTTLTCADAKCSSPAGFAIDSARQDFQIFACIDSPGRGLYFNPGERSSATLSVVSLPDITVESIDVPKNTAPGVPFSIGVVLKNKGTLASGGVKYKAGFYKSSEKIPFKTVDNVVSAALPVIGAGGDYKINIPIQLEAGKYTLKVEADPTDSSNIAGRIDEWDETNNILTKEFTV